MYAMMHPSWYDLKFLIQTALYILKYRLTMILTHDLAMPILFYGLLKDH